MNSVFPNRKRVTVDAWVQCPDQQSVDDIRVMSVNNILEFHNIDIGAPIQ